MSKVLTYINNGRSPVKIKDAKGAVVLVKVGEAVELDEKGAKIASSISGFQDLSKMVKPSGTDSAALLKEIAALKAERAVLLAKLAEVEKEREDLLS